MVMKSFTRENMIFKVDPARKDAVEKEILERFGDRIQFRFEGDEIIITGDGLSDYRIHETLLYILTEGKYGKNL